jgi:hypothetical protein
MSGKADYVVTLYNGKKLFFSRLASAERYFEQNDGAYLSMTKGGIIRQARNNRVKMADGTSYRFDTLVEATQFYHENDAVELKSDDGTVILTRGGYCLSGAEMELVRHCVDYYLCDEAGAEDFMERVRALYRKISIQ